MSQVKVKFGFNKQHNFVVDTLNLYGKQDCDQSMWGRIDMYTSWEKHVVAFQKATCYRYMHTVAIF